MTKDTKTDINEEVMQDLVSSIRMLREKYGLTLEEMERHVGIVYFAMKAEAPSAAH
jgi:hypothetical protein